MINSIVKNNLCCGCHACYLACPHDAIEMHISTRGIYEPLVNPVKCTKCGLCKAACPTLTITRQIDIGLGRYIRCYIGHSRDERIRMDGASGGLATTILLHLLEKGLVNSVMVVCENPKNSLKPMMKLVKSREEVIRAQGSKYCPVSLRLKVKDIRKEKAKIAIVGLPCHIWAFRKLEEIFPELKDKIFIHIGLFCGFCANIYATIYFLRKCVRINEDDVLKISYRGEGWPGTLKIVRKNGEVIKSSYIKWSAWLSSFYPFVPAPHFTPVRCAFCYDLTNQLADISLGDAWGLANNKIGTSAIITRTDIGEQVIQHLLKERKVRLAEVQPSELALGQGLVFKVKGVLAKTYLWNTLFHRTIPYTEKNICNLFSVKESILALCYCLLLFLSQKPFIRNALCNLTFMLYCIREKLWRYT